MNPCTTGRQRGVVPRVPEQRPIVGHRLELVHARRTGRDRLGTDSGDEARVPAPAAHARERPRLLPQPRPPEPTHRPLLLARRRKGAPLSLKTFLIKQLLS